MTEAEVKYLQHLSQQHLNLNLNLNQHLLVLVVVETWEAHLNLHPQVQTNLELAQNLLQTSLTDVEVNLLHLQDLLHLQAQTNLELVAEAVAAEEAAVAAVGAVHKWFTMDYGTKLNSLLV